MAKAYSAGALDRVCAPAWTQPATAPTHRWPVQPWESSSAPSAWCLRSWLGPVNAMLPRFLLLMPLRVQSPNSVNSTNVATGLRSLRSSKMFVALLSAKLWPAPTPARRRTPPVDPVCHADRCSCISSGLLLPWAATHTASRSTICHADRCPCIDIHHRATGAFGGIGEGHDGGLVSRTRAWRWPTMREARPVAKWIVYVARIIADECSDGYVRGAGVAEE